MQINNNLYLVTSAVLFTWPAKPWACKTLSF
jgi:hypothetical protein